jgi:hypothetical protein
MKNAQVVKEDDYRKQKQLNHYGPPHQQSRSYGRNDNNKQLNTTYDRENYQDKRSRNDFGRSPSGNNNRNGASFYDEEKEVLENSADHHAPRSTT